MTSFTLILSLRLICVFITGFSLCGCGSVSVLELKLKEAQRERKILRDAYEAQQLRLREVETRLLRLEDHDLASVSKNNSVGRHGKQSALQSEKKSYLWTKERMRALPVVMVKRDQGSRIDEQRSDQLELTQDKPVKHKRSLNKPLRQWTPSQRSVRQRKREKQSTHSVAKVPTLTPENVSSFRNPDSDESKALVTQKQKSIFSQKKLGKRDQAPMPSLKLNRRPRTEYSSISDERKLTVREQRGPKTEVPAVQNSPSITAIQAESLIGQRGGKVSQEPVRQTEEILLNQAQVMRKAGRLEESMRAVQRLISESPTHRLVPDALYLMGRLQIERGNQSAGRSTLLRLSRLYPRAQAAEKARQFLEQSGS
jgi:hypothetical protein